MLEILGNHFLCGLTIANAFNGGEKESKITYLCIRSIAEHLQNDKNAFGSTVSKQNENSSLWEIAPNDGVITSNPRMFRHLAQRRESPVSIESFLEINESVRFAHFVRFQ